MSRAVRQIRRQVAGIAANVAGQSRRSPRYLSGQAAAGLHGSQVLQLPALFVSNVQDLTPGSSTYGQFWMMVGYDPVGTAPVGPPEPI